MSDVNATMARLERARPGKVILWTLLFLGGVVMITPIVFMAATSFKTGQEVFELSIIPDSRRWRTICSSCRNQNLCAGC
jgi:ABC-type glycerol-3-phosphate transport system permease component